MRSSSTARFQKKLACPTAGALLRYAREALTEERRASVAVHLATCDFCGAEAQLLSRFAPPTTKALPFVAAPLPRHLRRLAEDLLALPSYKRARFAESLLEIERLTLTDA
jgi:anti-sigma factor RsiW